MTVLTHTGAPQKKNEKGDRRPRKLFGRLVGHASASRASRLSNCSDPSAVG